MNKPKLWKGNALDGVWEITIKINLMFISSGCSIWSKEMENEDYEKSNREKKLTPKPHTRHWCDTCDANLVHAGEKCAVCGHRDSHRVLKKE